MEKILPNTILDQCGKSPRVMSYDYDSELAFTKSSERLNEAVDLLLATVKSMHTSNLVKPRPIVFIAYSLGGILVKKVYLMSLKCVS